LATVLVCKSSCIEEKLVLEECRNFEGKKVLRGWLAGCVDAICDREARMFRCARAEKARVRDLIRGAHTNRGLVGVIRILLYGLKDHGEKTVRAHTNQASVYFGSHSFS
jgi:hypothetical protein